MAHITETIPEELIHAGTRLIWANTTEIYGSMQHK
jgi:hypothetical protein